MRKYYYHQEVHPHTNRVCLYTCALKELPSARTKSSYICSEFKRGMQDQKALSGKFIHFGQIVYFVEHGEANTAHANRLAYVRWYGVTNFHPETKLWYAKLDQQGVKSSYILTKFLSHPLVTVIEDDNIWFLNSGKLPVHVQ